MYKKILFLSCFVFTQLFTSKQKLTKIFSQHIDKKICAVYIIDQTKHLQSKVEFYREGKKTPIAEVIPNSRIRLMWWDKKTHIFYAKFRTNEIQTFDVRYMR